MSHQIANNSFSRLTGFMKLHGEWASLMATIIGLCLFLHHEDVNMNHRLDEHMNEIHRKTDAANHQLNVRIDSANERADLLHREFFELLKEMRDKK